MVEDFPFSNDEIVYGEGEHPGRIFRCVQKIRIKEDKIQEKRKYEEEKNLIIAYIRSIIRFIKEQRIKVDLYFEQISELKNELYTFGISNIDNIEKTYPITREIIFKFHNERIKSCYCKKSAKIQNIKEIMSLLPKDSFLYKTFLIINTEIDKLEKENKIIINSSIFGVDTEQLSNYYIGSHLIDIEKHGRQSIYYSKYISCIK
jgi:hypothetical protein